MPIQPRADAQTGLFLVATAAVSVCLELSQLLLLAFCCLVYILIVNCGVRWQQRRIAHASTALQAHGQQPPPRPSLRPPFRPSSQLPVRQESKVPLQAPSFQSSGFSAQVSELLELITPSNASENVAKELAEYAQTIIRETFPGAEVQGFANNDVFRGTAFGVAVPELDLVVIADPDTLEKQLQGRLSKGGVPKARMDARKMQKSAIRACTDVLVAAGGFKFRRSAFRCEEPKVTLMAPGTMSVSGQGIPFDFWVNCATPSYHAALLSDCSKIDARARGLILLVRRWSKDRGVCHVARGHLPPYAWTLLVIFYLQVGDAAIMPPLQCTSSDSGLSVQPGNDFNMLPRHAELSVGDLFRGLIGFYQHNINWQSEVVSVRLGRKETPDKCIKSQLTPSSDGGCVAGPSIEDPFEPSRDLGANLSQEGLWRLREELARADSLLASGDKASLTALLEPWAPPERQKLGSGERLCEAADAVVVADPSRTYGSPM